jgi:hypothetical protein
MTTDIYAVFADENVQHAAFCRGALAQLVRKPPPILWYNTSASTFSAIAHSGEVWSTQISCLNDHTEFRYAVTLVPTP